VPLIARGSLLEQVEEEDQGRTGFPKLTWKMAVKMEKERDDTLIQVSR